MPLLRFRAALLAVWQSSCALVPHPTFCRDSPSKSRERWSFCPVSSSRLSAERHCQTWLKVGFWRGIPGIRLVSLLDALCLRSFASDAPRLTWSHLIRYLAFPTTHYLWLEHATPHKARPGRDVPTGRA